MKTNPSFSFKWATILFNYKDYQIKYRGGIEPPTQGFSEYCSTKNACK